MKAKFQDHVAFFSVISARQLQIWIKGLSYWGLFIDNTKQAVKFVTLNKNCELGWPGLDSLVKRGAECWQIGKKETRPLL